MYGSPCKTYPTHSTPKQYWIRAVTSFHAFDPIHNAGYIPITTSFLEYVAPGIYIFIELCNYCTSVTVFTKQVALILIDGLALTRIGHKLSYPI